MTDKGKKIVRIINCCVWIIAVVVMLSLAVVFKMMADGKIGYMPTIEELENPIDKYASQVISSDGVVLGTYSREKNKKTQKQNLQKGGKRHESRSFKSETRNSC